MSSFSAHGDLQCKWEAPIMRVYARSPTNIEAVKHTATEVVSLLTDAGMPTFVEILSIYPGALMTPDALDFLATEFKGEAFKKRLAVITVIETVPEFNGATIALMQEELMKSVGMAHFFAEDMQAAEQMALDIMKDYQSR